MRLRYKLGLTAAILLTPIAVLVIMSAWNNRDGKCLISKPWHVVRGYVDSRGGGLFSTARSVYVFRYRGTCERSGTECTVPICVPETVYSEWYSKRYMNSGEVKP